MSADILMFVEDPGAANWVAAILPHLGAAGIGVRLIAEGTAAPYLAERGIKSDTPPQGVEAARMLLDSDQHRLVMVGTSENLDTLGLSLIAEARRRGLPTVSFVDQAVNAQHRFRGRTRNPMAFAPDTLLLPHETARRAFAALGFAPEQLIVTGHPHYDRLREAAQTFAREGRATLRARVCPQAPAGRPLIVFLAEIGYVVNPEGAQWERDLLFAGRGKDFPRGKATYRTAVVLEELLDAVAGLTPRPFVVVRLHPKNAADEFSTYASEVDAFSSGGDPLPLVFAADLVVGMASALLEEAHIMGRPTLSILPRAEEREWLEALRDGQIESVSSRQELHAALMRKFATTMLGRKPDAIADEGACSRVVATICRQLEISNSHG